MDSFWYLATPYTKYPGGPEVAFEHACCVAAWFMERGIPVFSPIAHTHPVSQQIEPECNTHEFWMRQDEPLMRAACGLIVVRMVGWEESAGVAQEIKRFRWMGKPVLYADPPPLVRAWRAQETA